MGRLRYKGAPLFLACRTNISSIYGIVCSIVFVLCVPVGGVVLRLVSVLYSLMVEKVERLLRGQWSAFNIYRASRWASRLLRLVFLLVPPSRGSVSLFVLSRAFRLVVLRWRLVSFCPCVLFIVRLVGAAYVVGVSCRLFASCLVSPIGLFRLSRLVVSLSWRVAARVGRGRRGRRRWCSLVVMRCCGGGVPAPVFSICSAGVGR